MKFIKLSTLKHLTLVKIAVTLWEVQKSKYNLFEFLIKNAYDSTPGRFTSLELLFKREWCEVRDEVLNHAKTLPLPESLKKELPRFVAGVGFEIAKWLHFHKLHDLFLDIPDIIVWDQIGIINLVNTAEVLVCNERLAIVDRYKLACAYCLENHISMLWTQLVEEKQECAIAWLRDHKYPLVCYWTDYNENKLDPSYLVTSYFQDSGDYNDDQACGFLISALNGNASAARFYFQKMTNEERDRVFLKTISMFFELPFPPREVPAQQDFIYFSLSASNEEQQTYIFKRYPFECLTLFLEWPWQDVFMEAYQCIKPLSKVKLYELYKLLVDKDTHNYDCYDYKKIFHMVFQLNSEHHDIDRPLIDFQPVVQNMCMSVMVNMNSED